MDKISAQLRLRSAFRYGYFAFLLAMAITVVGILFSADELAFFIRSSVLQVTGIVGMVGLGLIVPLFLFSWVLVGFTILNRARETPESA